MSKEIRFQRNELVWQTRIIYWDAEDWDKLKTWVKNQVQKAQKPEYKGGSWYQSFIKVYDVIKDMSWDDAVAEYQKWDNSDKNSLYWEEETTTYNGESYVYKTYFGDWLLEQMREDVYNADIDSEDYADDSEEYIEIYDSEENK